MIETHLAQRPAAAQPQTLWGRLGWAVRAAARNLPQQLGRNPAILIFLSVYAIVKLGANLWLGAAPLTALRSLVTGLLAYALMVIVVDTIHVYREGCFRDLSLAGTAWARKNPLALGILLVMWLVWGLMIIDGLQRRGAMPVLPLVGGPLLGWMPGWEALLAVIAGWGERLHTLYPALPAVVYASRIENVLLRVLLPLGVMLALGYHWRDFSLTFKNWVVLAPFFAIGLAVLLLNGPTLTTIIFLALSCLYPGLTEELLYRGLLQRALAAWLRPGSALLAAALLFGLLHLPSFWFEIYPHPLMAVGNVFDVTLTGLVWGYTFLRMGSILPLAVYHALADVAGI